MLETVRTRLDADDSVADEWGLLVLAALEGDAALEPLLHAADESATREETQAPARDARRAAAATPTDTSASPAIGAFLHSISVEGFRGIGPRATLEFPPGPGLTLVVGRNGSGKSSFAEALELLLTGDTFRWAQRTKVWREGWRNLHHASAAVAAEMVLEGQPGRCRVERQWPDDADLAAGITHAQTHGRPRADLASLGWEAALANYRPFLSYNELGSLLDEGPSKLYDALASILGLDDLVQAQTALRQARTDRERAKKDAASRRDRLVATLAALPDERARAIARALKEKDWGLDDVALQLQGATPPDDAGELAALRGLAALAAPSEETVSAATAALRHAATALSSTAGTLAARSRDLAALLDHALRFHGDYGDGPCPVCEREGALDLAWHEAKAGEMASLRDDATSAAAAQKLAETALASASALTLSPTSRTLLDHAARLGLDPEPTRGALVAWPETPAKPSSTDADGGLAGLAEAVEAATPALRGAADALRISARAQLDAREDAWRPVAIQIAEWLPVARSARDGAAHVAGIKKAEKWLKQAAEDLRNERFAPIADQTLAVWEQLRQQSHVSLGRIHLGGSGKGRRVELDVTVDGAAGAALGVMSQGELHSLALSLFIPRATLAESPFRFMVIDDPVQSMDPARVDGLARVFEAVARDRQVVVFTHDDRLPEAVRRLGIDAHVFEVTRRDASRVEVRPGKDPVARYIEDAVALARTDTLPSPAARRVVPGLCRHALEAACMQTVRRRRLDRGDAHASVEEALQGAGKLTTLAALALFDDPGRAGDVLARLDKQRRSFADTFRACNEGVHGAASVPGLDLVRDTENLARWIQGLPA
jgi:recombinational DNA repair ATPase RecF